MAKFTSNMTKKKNLVLHTDIQSGSEYRDKDFKQMSAIVDTKNGMINICGIARKFNSATREYSWVNFDRTFKVGDYVKTGSYNLIYTDKILSVSDRSVTADTVYSSVSKRFDLQDFIRTNWDLDLDKIREHNSEEMMYI